MSANNRPSKDATTSSAALRGAALAFGKPPVKPKPKSNTYSGSNGALAAATKAGGGGGGSTQATSKNLSKFEPTKGNERPGYMGFDGTGGSPNNRQHPTERSPSIQRIQQNETGRNGGNGGNGLLRVDQARSASYIAANLAASRSPSASPGQSPNVTGNQRSSMNSAREARSTQRSLSPLKSSSSSRSSDLDLSSIPPTTSLISMFEKSKTRPISLPPTKKPVAASSRVNDYSPSRQRARVPTRARTPSPRPKPKPELRPRARTPSPVPVTKSRKPEKPQAPLRVQPPSIPDEPSKVQRPPPPVTPAKPKSIPSRPIPETQKEEEEGEASSDDSFVSASDYKPSFRAELQQRRFNSTSGASTKSSVTVDSLANAIVASSLASSRAASPSSNLLPPPPPTRRGARRHLFHSSNNNSRSASPQKVDKNPKPPGLRTTMRKPPKPDEEIDEGAKRRTKKAHLMKKHPNKHHEGDRKRWRDEITERERKRYEAVWASNKNLHMSPSTPNADRETSVCNLVVRDIWSRSRLHFDELAEAYELIDRTGRGYLGKEEFVVGLWLVDQRLKGRKLPIRVSNSVWQSVGVLSGIKVKTVKH